MYESPIDLIMGELETSYKQMINDRETAIMAEINQQMGIDINKRELLMALNYDRNQYEKGYNEGYDSAISNLTTANSAQCIDKYFILEADKDELEHYKEFIKKRLCNELADYMYNHNLVTFEEKPLSELGTCITASIKVYSETKETTD